MKHKLWAEFMGTFSLVFAGAGAITINEISQGSITHVGIALVFGLIVLAMIYAVGNVSGAHLNPAVTIGFYFAKRFPGREVFPYCITQFLGAVCASAILWFLFPESETFGATLPAGSATQTFVLEIVLTCILMFVILCVSTGAKEKGITAGIAIGATVGLCAMFGGPISGASMNPARSLGPAIFAGELSTVWIYFAAPVLGALVAVLACCAMYAGECCRPFEKCAES